MVRKRFCIMACFAKVAHLDKRESAIMKMYGGLAGMGSGSHDGMFPAIARARRRRRAARACHCSWSAINCGLAQGPTHASSLAGCLAIVERLRDTGISMLAPA